MSRILLCMSMLGIMVYAESYDLNRYVDLQIKLKKNNNKVHFILNCSSIIAPFGRSAEFLVNDITRANIRSSNGVCYISRRICRDYECSCTSEIYVWSFWSTTDAQKLLVFTCQLRFEQENRKSHVLVYKTKIYNGSDIFEERTNFQQIHVSMSDSTQNTNFTVPAKDSGDFPIVYISIIICVPVAIAIVSLSILCLKCFNRRKRKMCMMSMYTHDSGQPVGLKENSEQKGHTQAREDNLYTDMTKSNENGIEETTYSYPRLRIERQMHENEDNTTVSTEETAKQEGHIKTREEDNLYTNMTISNESGTEGKTNICHSIRKEQQMHENEDNTTVSTEASSLLYTNLDEMGFKDEGINCHRLSEETAKQEGHIKTREEDNLYTNMTISNESGTEGKTNICHNIRKERQMHENEDKTTVSTEASSLLYTNLDEMGFEDKGINCHRISEERKMHENEDNSTLFAEASPLLEHAEEQLQTKQKDIVYTNLDEMGFEDKGLQGHRISAASPLLEHAEEQLQTKQKDIVYTNLDEMGFEDKGLQGHRISAEPKMNEVDGGRQLSHEESLGGNRKQTHSQTAFNKQEIHTKSVRDQNNTDHLTKSLNFKEPIGERR